MVPVGTKVSPEAYARLQSIAKERGMTVYDMLQMFCDVMIRYMDDRHNLSEHMNQMIVIFDGINSWDKSNTLLNLERTAKILEAFYVIGGIKSGTKSVTLEGRRVMHVEGGQNELFHDRTCTFNIQEIMEKFICILVPEVYKHLRRIGTELHTNSVLETMLKLAEWHSDNETAAELRRIFEDNDWVQNAKTSSQQPTKSTRTNHPELFQ